MTAPSQAMNEKICAIIRGREQAALNIEADACLPPDVVLIGNTRQTVVLTGEGLFGPFDVSIDNLRGFFRESFGLKGSR